MHTHHRARLPLRTLADYLKAVARAAQVPAEAVWSEINEPATAYLALSRRTPECPNRDLLLVWGEQDGWLIAAETGPTEPPMVLAYLGGTDIAPPPHTVTRFVTDMIAGRRPGQLQPPGIRTVGDHDDLADRLTRYTTQ